MSRPFNALFKLTTATLPGYMNEDITACRNLFELVYLLRRFYNERQFANFTGNNISTALYQLYAHTKNGAIMTKNLSDYTEETVLEKSIILQRKLYERAMKLDVAEFKPAELSLIIDTLQREDDDSETRLLEHFIDHFEARGVTLHHRHYADLAVKISARRGSMYTKFGEFLSKMLLTSNRSLTLGENLCIFQILRAQTPATRATIRELLPVISERVLPELEQIGTDELVEFFLTFSTLTMKKRLSGKCFAALARVISMMETRLAEIPEHKVASVCIFLNRLKLKTGKAFVEEALKNYAAELGRKRLDTLVVLTFALMRLGGEEDVIFLGLNEILNRPQEERNEHHKHISLMLKYYEARRKADRMRPRVSRFGQGLAGIRG